MSRRQWWIVAGIVVAVIALIVVLFLAADSDSDTAEPDATTAPTSAPTSAPPSTPAPTDPPAEDTPSAVQISSDFAQDEQGWVAGFADYPPGEEDFFELDSGWRELPDDLDGGGFFLTGSNRSDDLLMFITLEVDGLAPDTAYTASWVVELATNVPSGLVGIGGSPTESVYLKAGLLPAVPTVEDEGGILRLQADVGSQSQGGANAAVLGTLDNPNVDDSAGDPPPFALFEVDGASQPITVTSDGSGSLWLFFGVDSGFEGPTTVYVSNVEVDLQPAG